ncbi:glycosyltransferase [Luteolibacter marinus]|uniref:glycosyltransferase n=1 Tax=Luteolibacter marinus TaxID=2776705 RepID=UPI001865C96F
MSIIIPCYNKERYVAAAIESALSQSYPAEVIVVNDGSIDRSLEEIEPFADRIHLITGPNRGASSARNTGIESATGEWIQFFDADDILPPEKIAVQIAAMEGAESDSMAVCPWARFYDDGRIDTPDPRRFWNTYADGLSLLVDMWYDGGFFPPHCWLVHRQLIQKVGGWNTRLTGDDDGEFFGRLLAQAREVRFCNETQVFYRDPPEGSISSDRSLKSARSFFEAFEIVSKLILEIRSDRHARKACLSRARKTAYAWQNVPEIIGRAAAFEEECGVSGFSPSLPVCARLLAGLFGIQGALRIKKQFQR